MSVPPSFLSDVVALFGHPVAENPTQYMQEQAFAALGLNWRYLTLDVLPEQLADAVRGMRAMNFAGGNCTIPHKIAVMPLLDAVSDSAAKIGAVNTILRGPDGCLTGENTDGKGFIRSVREAGFDLRGCRAMVLGAGGAARAIAVELGDAGAASLTLVNRTAHRAEELAQRVRATTGTDCEACEWAGAVRVPAGTNLVVNATSIGLFPDTEAVVPLDYDTLAPGTLVCDVIPNPPRTPFLRLAGERGAATLDGLGMLVNQGAIGFKLWTGREAPRDVMRRALEEVFGS